MTGIGSPVEYGQERPKEWESNRCEVLVGVET